MLKLLSILFISELSFGAGKVAISKVDRKTPVFAACDLQNDQSKIQSGSWFKYKNGKLYLAQKDIKNEVRLTQIKGDCTLEPNFIR